MKGGTIVALVGYLATPLSLGGCGAAVFRPERPISAAASGAEATLTSLRLSADERLRISSRWQAPPGTAIRSARVVPVGESPCGDGSVSSAASVLRIEGETKWQRPLPLVAGAELELELPDADRALHTGAVLDFELHGPAGASCLRLPLAEETGNRWTPVKTPALGVGLSVDQIGFVAVARPGLWVGPFRHGLELGAGDSRGVDGRKTVLPLGRMLVLGWMTERLWTLPPGLFGFSLAAGYQARALLDAPAAGQSRLAHGARLVVRPFVFPATVTERLPVQGRLGYLAVMELAFSFWLSGDGKESAGTFGVGITWDRPLTRF